LEIKGIGQHLDEVAETHGFIDFTLFAPLLDSFKLQ